MDYDPMGRITARRVFDQNSNNLSTEYFYYNQNGELQWYDGPRSNPEDYVYHVYDAAGRGIFSKLNSDRKARATEAVWKRRPATPLMRRFPNLRWFWQSNVGR